jgi:hypothetical protein
MVEAEVKAEVEIESGRDQRRALQTEHAPHKELVGTGRG